MFIVKKICKICGKEFSYNSDYCKSKNRDYCSLLCFNHSKMKERENRFCEYCGNEFIASKHLSGKYCSHKCYLADRVGKHFPRKNKAKERKPRLIPWQIKSGEWYIKDEDGKRMRYHKYLGEKMIGRKLNKDELVHHIDGDHHNNKEDNLKVITRGEHNKFHNRITGKLIK